MKLRNLIAASSAAIVGLAAMTATASANEAFLMFADGSWAAQSMDATTCPDGNTDVTGDGTYTVWATFEVEDEDTAEMVPFAAEGVTVFCVDIAGLAADNNAGKDADGYDNCQTGADKMAFAKAAGIEVSNVIVTLNDGTDVPVDQSKIIFGDIEGNGKIRIEIYNAYGDTSADAPIDTANVTAAEKVAVTFTISGLGGGANDSAPADDGDTNTAPAPSTPSTTDKGSPDTGVEGVVAVAGVAALAAGALVISKKRK